MKNLIIKFLLFLFFFHSIETHALYDECIAPQEHGDINKNTFAVGAINADCASCYDTCEALVTDEVTDLMSIDEDDEEYSSTLSSLKAEYVSINQDVIDKCTFDCRQGESGKTYRIKKPNPDSNSYIPVSSWKNITLPSNSCTEPDNIYYNSGMEVANGDFFTLKLSAPSSGDENIIYMCGSKTVHIYPYYRSLESENWYDTSSVTIWQPNNYSFTSGNWRQYGVSHWHAKNPYFFNTGIIVKDGDYLQIRYGGKFQNSCDGQYNNTCYSTNTSSFTHSDCKKITCTGDQQQMQVTQMEKYNISSSPSNSDYKIDSIYGGNLGYIAGACDDDDCESYSYESGRTPDDYAESITDEGNWWYGLTPATEYSYNFDIGETYKVDDQDDEDAKSKTIIYSGILDGLSDNFTLLGIRSYDSYANNKNAIDNLGGHYVKMTWKGCAKEDATRFQMAYVEKDPTKGYDPSTISDSAWQDVSEDDILNQNLIEVNFTENASYSEHIAKIYFRVKPYSSDDYSNYAPVGVSNATYGTYIDSNMAQYFSSSGAYGYQYLTISKEDLSGIGNLISEIVQDLRITLFDESEGIVPETFKVIAGSKVRTAIQATILLYIALAGIGIIIGTIKLTGQEFANRFIKLGIVVALIGDSSWNFFNEYLFVAVIDGGLDLILAVIPDSLQITYNSTDTDIDIRLLRVFSLLETNLYYLIAPTTFYRIIAVIVSGPLGWNIALFIVIAMIFNFLMLIKLVLIYMLSMLMLSIMIMLAPLFIACILFKFTFQYFKAWLQVLLSFTLQPVAAFAVSSIVLIALIYVMLITLSFGICKETFSILGLIDIFDYYVSISGAHTPTNIASSPIPGYIAAIVYVVVAYAGLTLLPMMTEIIGQIAGGMFMAPTAGRVGGVQQSMQYAAQKQQAVQKKFQSFMGKRNVIVFLFLLIAPYNSIAADYTTECSSDKTCYAKDDYGIYESYCILAQPEWVINVKEDGVIVEHSKWVDTELYTYGVSSTDDYRSYIQFYVSGEWFPWGYRNGLGECKPYSECTDGDCFDEDVFHTKLDHESGDSPCYLEGAMGLYGAIAFKDGDGNYANPNTEENFSDLPSSKFATFHIGDIDSTIDSIGNKFEISTVKTCLRGEECTEYKDADGNPYIPEGKLYLRITDTGNAYSDNEGGYLVDVTGGVRATVGSFISDFIEKFDDVISSVTKTLYINLVEDTEFILIVRILLMLYIAIMGFQFMMGSTQNTLSDIVLGAVKIGIISALISPQSWDFFNNYLFTFIHELGETIAEVLLADIVLDTLYDANNVVYTDTSNVFTAFDTIQIFFSGAIINKTFSALLTKKFLLVLVMILAICWFFNILIKAMLMVIISSAMLGLLTFTAPIFIIMILFKKTFDLFTTWLKSMVSASLIILMVYCFIVLMIPLVFGKLEQLYNFTICQGCFFTDSFCLWKTHYYVQSYNELDNAINKKSVFNFLLHTYLFRLLIDIIPQIADALSNAGRLPFNTVMRGVTGGYASGRSDLMNRTAEVTGAVTRKVAIPAVQKTAGALGSGAKSVWGRGRGR